MGNATVDLSKLKRVEKSEDNTVSKTVDLSKLKRVASERKEGEGYLPSELPADVPGSPAANAYKNEVDPYAEGKPLPTPTDAMYDSRDEESARRIERLYKNALSNGDPKAKKDALGRLTYEGVIVPSVDDQFNELGRQSGPTGRIVSTALSEAQDGLKETVTTVLSLGDALNSLVGIESKGGETVDEAFGEHKQEGVLDNIVGVLTQAIMGASGAKKGIEPLAANVKNVATSVARNLIKTDKNLVRALAKNEEELTKFTKFLIQESGAAAAMNPDDNSMGVFDTAEKSISGYFATGAEDIPLELAFDEEGNFSQELLMGKLELLAENLLIGGGVVAGQKAGSAVYNFGKQTFANPLQAFFSAAAREEGQAKRIIREITGQQTVKPETIQKLKEFARKGAVVDVKSTDRVGGAVKDFESELNTADAIARGAILKNEELTKELTLLKEKAAGGYEPTIAQRISEIQAEITENSKIADGSLRTGMSYEKTRALPSTGVQDKNAINSVSDYTNKTSDNLGGVGDRNIDEAADTSVQISKEKQALELDTVRNLETSQKKLMDDQVIEILQTDPILREALESVDSKVLNDFDVSSLTRRSTEELAQEVVKIEAMVKAEMDALYETAKKKGARVKLSNSSKWNEAVADLRETDPSTFKKIFPNGNVPETFGQLDDHLKKAREVANSSTFRESKEFDRLQNLIKVMDKGAIDELSESKKLAGPAQEALQKAKTYANDVYFRLFEGDTALAYPRTDKIGRDGVRASVAGFEKGGMEAIEEIFADRTRKLLPILNEQLTKTGRQDLVASRLKYEFLEDVRTKAAKAGGLENVDTQTLRDSLKDLPFEGQEKQDIINFLDKFDTAKVNQKEFNLMLDQTRKDADAAYEKIKVLELNKFLTEDEIMRGVSSSDIFKNLIAGAAKDQGQSFESLSRIVGNINSSDNELAKKGLMSAWFRAFREEITTSTGNTNLSKLQELVSPGSSFMKTGKMVMKSNPQVLDFVKEIIAQVNKVDSAKKQLEPSIKAESKLTSEFNLAQRATNKLITIFMGPLSRPGARARTVTSGILENADPEQMTLELLDSLFSDPETFVKVADIVANKMGPEEMSPEMKRFVYETLARSTSGTLESIDEGYYQYQNLPPEVLTEEDKLLENSK